MGIDSLPEVHSREDSGRAYISGRLVRDWIKNPSPSSLVLPYLHKELMKNDKEYSKKGYIPLPPGAYRDTDVTTSSENKPGNFYASGLDVAELMRMYAPELDKILEKLPNEPLGHVEEVSQSAAWAYYVFGRIHPFLDGDGRVGRVILKRIIKASGFKDLNLHDARWLGANRSKHLTALDRVDKTGNIRFLELFLLDSLESSYLDNNSNSKSGKIYQEIQDVKKKKISELLNQQCKTPLSDIWEGFKGKNIDGNEEHVFLKSRPQLR